MTSPPDTLDRFIALWSRLGCTGDPAPVHCALIVAYSQPHRAYHNLEHLRDCLTLLDRDRSLADNSDLVEIALWFHDAAYDPRAQDNEARSAAWAADALGAAGASNRVKDEVVRLILGTQLHETSPDPNSQLLSDIDLSILGRDSRDFDAYDARIRIEYGWVPEPGYRRGRARILAAFLGRPRIFQTAAYHDRNERQARSNLQRALERLTLREDNFMLRSAEVRWFFPKALPKFVLDWFGADLTPEPKREDAYLIFPGCKSVGVKLRGGTLEVKALETGPKVMAIADGIKGQTDRWAKWCFSDGGLSAFEAPLKQSGRWYKVGKERRLRKFSADNGAPVEVAAGDRPERGCIVELTRLEVDADPDKWFTLGFEAFGDPATVEQTLADTVRVFFEKHQRMPRKRLSKSNSQSYPAWLAEIAAEPGPVQFDDLQREEGSEKHYA